MGAVIMSQILFIFVFKFWPDSERKPAPPMQFDKEAIVVEEIVATRQPNVAAAPPKPSVAIIAPEFEIIEEDYLEFPDIDTYLQSDALGESFSTGTDGGEARISGNPDRPPRVIKIVEPVVPEEAKEAGIKAMIYVNFTVNDEGIVVDAYIDQIRLYEGGGSEYKVVKDLGYGLLEATIDAALKWKFSPAREDGEKVGAYARDIFTFGF